MRCSVQTPYYHAQELSSDVLVLNYLKKNFLIFPKFGAQILQLNGQNLYFKFAKVPGRGVLKFRNFNGSHLSQFCTSI